MVKPRAREAGEGVDDAAYTGCIVQHDKGVNRVMIHRLACFYYLRILTDRFRMTCHDIANRGGKERLPQTLHRTTNISVCDNTNEIGDW